MITVDDEGNYDLAAIKTALLQHKSQMLAARERRYDAVLEYNKPYHGDLVGVATSRAVPQARQFMFNRAVQVYCRLLAARRPKVNVRTWDSDGRPYAGLLEKGVNNQLKVMKMESVFKRCVLDAMFAAGSTKTGIDTTGSVYCKEVDFDDLVLDHAANNIKDMRYIGNFYRMPYSEVENIVPAEYAKITQVYIGDPWDVKPLSTPLPPDTIEPEVEFLDVFLVRERMIVTFVTSNRTSFTELSVTPYVGPEEGPFDLLYLGEQPKSVLPMPPGWVMKELSRAIDEITSKLFRQARRQKNIIVGPDKKDLERIMKSMDSDYLVTNRDAREAASELSFGAPNQQNFSFILAAAEMFNEAAGNVKVLAGLGTEADTAHQEELLNQNAGGMIDEMRDRVQSFAAAICTKIAWYLWHGNMVLPIDVSSTNGTATVTMMWTKEMRTQGWDQFDFSIEPYSMVPETPATERDKINELVSTVIIPLMPALAQQGYILDAAKLVELNAKLSNLPEISEIIRMNPAIAMMAQQQGGGQQSQTPNPQKPNGKYERTSRRGAPTQGARNAELQAAAQGAAQEAVA